MTLVIPGDPTHEAEARKGESNMYLASVNCDHVGCHLPIRTRCSLCGGSFCVRHIRWMRGSYYRGGYYACDACIRQRDASFWAALLALAAIVLTPMVAFTGWMLFDFSQLVVHGLMGA